MRDLVRRRANEKARYARDSERILAVRRAWKKANSEKIRAWQAEYRRKNYDRLKKQAAIWRKANPEKVRINCLKASRKYRRTEKGRAAAREQQRKARSSAAPRYVKGLLSLQYGRIPRSAWPEELVAAKAAQLLLHRKTRLSALSREVRLGIDREYHKSYYQRNNKIWRERYNAKRTQRAKNAKRRPQSAGRGLR